MLLRAIHCLLAVFLLMPLSVIASEQSGQDIQQKFRQVSLVEFFNENQLSREMAEEKKRVMLPPDAVRFRARLMALPKPGQFSLVYDALNIWGGVDRGGEKPEVTHSAFIGLSSGPVLGMYLSSGAVSQLVEFSVGDELTFYAVHLYNYSGGPRLVVLGAES